MIESISHSNDQRGNAPQPSRKLPVLGSSLLLLAVVGFSAIETTSAAAQPATDADAAQAPASSADAAESVEAPEPTASVDVAELMAAIRTRP